MLEKAKKLAKYTGRLPAGTKWGVDDQDILEWLIEQAEERHDLAKKMAELEKDIVTGYCKSIIGLRQYLAGSKLVEVQIVFTTEQGDFCLGT